MPKMSGSHPRSFDGWEATFKNDWWTIWRRDGWHALASKNGECAVGIFVVDAASRVVLNRIYRISVDEYCLEIPRGGIDAGEEPEDAAVRELHEETGLVVKKEDLIPLGQFYPDSGILAHTGCLFAVQLGYEVGNLSPIDTDEVSEHELLSLEVLRNGISSGLVKDSFTIAAERFYSLRKDSKHMVIEVLDENKEVVANIVTSNPQWSFEEYCRNRGTANWTWREARLEDLGTPEG